MKTEVQRRSLTDRLKDGSGDWIPRRVAYLSKGNGEIVTDVVRPTSINGGAINMRFEGGAKRTYRDCLMMMLSNPEDATFENATKVYVG